MEIERQSMDVDIVCVGFGPAMAGFLTTLSRGLVRGDGMPIAESAVMPGMPPQVICYERAEDVGFGVSGVVTRGRSIRESFPNLDLGQIPMAALVTSEKVAWLFDPTGASRRSGLLKLGERFLPKGRHMAFELPYIPPFLRKHDGFVLSMGQFSQWVGAQVMGSGQVQIWPGMPVDSALIEGDRVAGVRLVDQGVSRKGDPEAGYMPGMDIKARLTVVGDGPVGGVGRQLDEAFGLPEGNTQQDYALGMKFVVELPESCDLAPGTVIHTLGYPEPEIFGFLYVYPDRVAAMGIFVPVWFESPVRTAYRYLQHWMQHPYIWRHVQGGTLRSWGAKSLQESGRRGEPHLAGDGWARIGEGSGTTNVLTGSGVDEAWFSGVQLAEGVLELLAAGRDFSRENLEAAYVARRRASWLDKESRAAEKARDGFQRGFIRGMIGVSLAGISSGWLYMPGDHRKTYERVPSLYEYFRGRIPGDEIESIRRECTAKGLPLYDALMDRAGWPRIEHDGVLLVSHQDALLVGGKVQAPPGYADHVLFRDPDVCVSCDAKVCIEACSGQAISSNPEGGAPLFDREKCVHCGACLWNCSKADKHNVERTNVEFRAGAGGLHSVEN